MAIQETLYARYQMMTSIASINAMVTVRINLRVELIISLNKGFGKLRRVLIVNIVVRCAMDEEQVTLQVLIAVER